MADDLTDFSFLAEPGDDQAFTADGTSGPHPRTAHDDPEEGAEAAPGGAKQPDLGVDVDEADAADGQGEAGDADDTPLVEETAPEHACRYCLLSDPACVVKCVSTGKWFCNGSHGLSSCSHIVFHLVKSRKSAVQLHPDSDQGDALLECYHCGDANLFTLGFVSASEDSVVVLVCRRCLQSKTGRDMDWRAEDWTAVVQERAIAPWLVQSPDKAAVARTRRLSTAVMTQLESLWRTDPNAHVADLDGARVEEALPSTQMQYADGFEYQHVMTKLVNAEAEYDRMVTEAQSISGITVTWSEQLSGQHTAHLSLGSIDRQLHIVPGASARLKCTTAGGPWEGTGSVTQAGDGFLNLLLSTRKVPTEVTVGFTLDLIWQDVAFRRMRDALSVFAEDDHCTDPGLYHAILGSPVNTPPLAIPVPRSADVPGMAPLNHSQEAALRAVLRQPLALIQGPPGTGKTVTAAAIVYHLTRARGTGQILVTAPSNVAVDHLAEKINRVGVKVVRVVAKSRESVPSPVTHLCLHDMVNQLAGSNTALGRLLELKKVLGELSMKDAARLKTLSRRTEGKLLDAAQVICTTCSAAADIRLSGRRFRHVLVDEATQATEPDIMVPIVRGARQLVLIGDHCQLGPVVLSKPAIKAGFNQSLFERFVASGMRPVRLEVQYRMHPCLSAFPSATFYEGALQDGVTAADRSRPAVAFPWPNPDKPMMFWSSVAREELSASGTSYINRAESSLVERVVTFLLRQGVPAGQIGVITPYTGQCTFIANVFRSSGGLPDSAYEEVEIASVDSFQGREKDYVVLSCVRSNDSLGIGFLSDPRRLNVALTRARFGLVTIGNPSVLATSPLWAALLTHFRANDALVEGPLTALRKCSVALPRPRPFQLPHSRRLADLASVSAEGAAAFAALPRFPGDRGGVPAPFFGAPDPFASFLPADSGTSSKRVGAGAGAGRRYGAIPQAPPTAGSGMLGAYGYVPFQSAGRGVDADDASSVSGASLSGFSVGAESGISHPSVVSAAYGHGAGIPRSFM